MLPCSGLAWRGPTTALAGMARKLRIQYPGAVYHVMNRGDRCPNPTKGGLLVAQGPLANLTKPRRGELLGPSRQTGHPKRGLARHLEVLRL